jgi:hypothetical protein
MRDLERRVDSVVGLDGVDEFGLALPPLAIARCSIVLKFQGLYRDRSLYNYEVGCLFPGANWTHKTQRRPEVYSDADLAKLHLSLPCYMFQLRPVRQGSRALEATLAGLARKLTTRLQRQISNIADWFVIPTLTVAGTGKRSLDVHCVVALSHVQRIETMRLLDGFSGDRGIVLPRGQKGVIAGTEHGMSLLPKEIHDELVASAKPYEHEAISRTRYMLATCRHRLVVAPTGYGELGHRHAQALMAGAALVCPDLSHVDMMYPFVDGGNVVFCQPDLADLRSTVNELLNDEERRRRIAHEARRSFIAWSRRWRDHLERGIEAPVRAALNSGSGAI